LNRHFSDENKQMAHKHMKRCSMLQVIRKTQIKTTMRHHLIPTRITIIIFLKNCWRDAEMEKLEHCCWACKMVDQGGGPSAMCT